MWMLMDSTLAGVHRHTRMSLADTENGGVISVYSRLIKDRDNAENFLRDANLQTAIEEISEVDEDGTERSRAQLQKLAQDKQEALEALKKRYYNKYLVLYVNGILSSS
jgi:vacuolar-type H+-ATPase subunit C/Vma6